MKNLVTLPLVLGALPAAAHDAPNLPTAHMHPHGTEFLVAAMVGLCVLGVAVWKAKGRS